MDRKPTYEELQQQIAYLNSELGKYFDKERESNRGITDHFKKLADRSKDAFYHYDIDSRRYLYSNKVALDLHGLEEGDAPTLSNKTVLLRIHPEDREKVKKAVTGSMAPGSQDGEVEYRFLHNDGSVRWMHDKWVIIHNSVGRPIAMEGIVRDYTDHKRAEEELVKQHALFYAVFDGLSDPLILLDIDLSVKMLNKTASGYFKVEIQDALHKPCYQAFQGRLEPCEGCSIAPALFEGRSVAFKREGFMSPDTVEQIVTYPVGEKSRVAGAVIHIKDITETIKLERELIQADKMISLGVLVSGVAHEINNPNNFIMLNAPILSDVLESISPILEKYYEENGDFNVGGLPYSEMRHEIPKLLSGILVGSNRIKRIVQELKYFSRQDPAEMSQTLDINGVIKNSITLISNMIRKSTKKFTVEYGKNLPLIRGSLQRLEQVFVNLIQNACQALPDKTKGIFMASSFNDTSGDIIVEVRDEGKGIPNEVLPRVMDPFFTTRRSYGGTGLGLSVSANIVKDHAGRITVDSQLGKGTAFKVFFPTIKTGEPVKVLVADDDDAIRELISKALEKHRNYSVHEASTGTEACIKLGSYCPDLVILDIMMPDIDGVEVCRLIKEEPGLSSTKVIVITGFIDSAEAREITRMDFKNILSKPFSINQFMQMVASVLENRPITPIE